MYLQNKYTTWYYNIIANARARVLDKTEYTEIHHIIPKSLGGTNSNSNLVTLTAREHFICHLLLTKMLTGKNQGKMQYALHMITNIRNIGEGRYKPTSKLYEYSRKRHKEALKDTWTLEKRQVQSEKIKKITKGRKMPDSAKEKLRRKVWTETAIQNRLNNCLQNAAKRKGVKNPTHGKVIFEAYIKNNIHLIEQIWEIFDKGINRRQIALTLGISWDRVNLAINKRDQIKDVLGELKLPKN